MKLVHDTNLKHKTSEPQTMISTIMLVPRVLPRVTVVSVALCWVAIDFTWLYLRQEPTGPVASHGYSQSIAAATTEEESLIVNISVAVANSDAQKTVIPRSCGCN